jgi:hypothetical protein
MIMVFVYDYTTEEEDPNISGMDEAGLTVWTEKAKISKRRGAV